MPRCSMCNKKTTLAGTFSCPCGKEFCSGHRFADQHACVAEDKIKEKEIQILKDQLVQVVADKLVDRIR